MSIDSLLLRRVLVAATGASLMLSSPARAADLVGPVPPAAAPRTPSVAVADVALGQGGTLRGQVFDAQAQPLPAAQVELLQAGRVVAQAATGEDGRFTMASLRGGVYQLAAGQHVGVYRLWTLGSEPPASRREVLLVADDGVVRGQETRGVWWWLTNPWIISGSLAAAVLVPVLISNDNGSSS